MKVLVFGLALVGVASAAPVTAQIVVPRGGTVITGSGQRRGDCTYNRTQTSVGDIIFGRNNLSTDCRDMRSREDGAWYQVGHGRDNRSIYERRVRDGNGNLVIQRARRNSDGSFTILSSRVANANDKEWRKAERQRDKELRKEHKESDKELRKSNTGNRGFDVNGGRGDDDEDDRNDDEDDRNEYDDDRGDGNRISDGVRRNDTGIFRAGNGSEPGDRGRGKGRKGGDD